MDRWSRAVGIDFEALIRALLAEIEIRREALRARTDYDQARAEILYLQGEEQ